MAIYGLCNVVRGTLGLDLDLHLDLNFGLKAASNVRCGRISFKLVMFSVCRPSLVMISTTLLYFYRLWAVSVSVIHVVSSLRVLISVEILYRVFFL